LFRSFVGLEIDDAVSSHAVINKNQDRLLDQEVAEPFRTGKGTAGEADVGRALPGGWHALAGGRAGGLGEAHLSPEEGETTRTGEGGLIVRV